MPKPVTEECAFDVRFLHEISGRLIRFFGRDSGPDEFAHVIENFARGVARLPHPLHFLGILNRYHAVILSSIKPEMPLKTASRSRFPSIRRKIDIFWQKSASGCVLLANSPSRVCKTLKSSSSPRTSRPSH